MTNDRAELLSHRLCDAVSAQKERLSEAVLDIQHNDSAYLLKCSEARAVMTRRLLDYGFGDYSVMSICCRLAESADEAFGPLPDEVPSTARAAARAYLYAVMGRESLIEGDRARSKQWLENLEDACAVSDQLVQFPEVVTETNDDSTIIQTAFDRLERAHKARAKIRRRRREQEQEKASIRQETEAMLIREATRLLERGIRPHNLASSVKKSTKVGWHVNTIRRILQDAGLVHRRIKKK